MEITIGLLVSFIANFYLLFHFYNLNKRISSLEDREKLIINNIDLAIKNTKTVLDLVEDLRDLREKEIKKTENVLMFKSFIPSDWN